MTKRQHDDEAKSEGNAAMKPFADDDGATTIGGLTIENGTDRLSISGSLDIAKDNVGLTQARELRHALDAIVAALEADADLPERAVSEDKRAAKTVKNPFA